MKTVWGFEPRNQDNASIKKMAKLLEQVTSTRAQDLNVAYVVTENESYLHTAFDVPFEDRLSTYPKKLILEDLKRSKVRVKPGSVHILHHRTLSTTTAVDKLLEFAKSRRAKLLALFTHNKKGIERLVMGSFAETAVHRSKIDLLLAGPRTKYPERVRSVLYASDFSPDSKLDLPRVLELCRRTKARLTVFHSGQITYRWSFDESNPEIHAYRRETNKMADWIERECKKARVSCSVVITAEFRSVPDLVFKAARSAKADLIVVSAKVGPFGALMGGSVTRNITRQGTYPVLILKR